MADRYDLRLPALEISQGSHKIYSFAVDGKQLHGFTTISRVKRTDGNLNGYQRSEVATHIRAIRRYLESDGAMLPNAIVLAFDKRVRFEPFIWASAVDYCAAGELIIPVDETLDDSKKPAWLVDGQQRAAAVRDADLDQFPLAAVGFIANNQEEQRSQFILVNNTKPLPPGLIHELLPSTTGSLPTRYARRQLPATLMVQLNSDPNGPFFERIATPTNPDGYIKDNSVLKMIENSLYDGALYQYRDPIDGSGDIKNMLLHLTIFWSLVRTTFQQEWKQVPRKSRLTHGVGIQAMGFVMDALTDGVPAEKLPRQHLEIPLRRIAQLAAWTGGTWDLDGEERRWNSLQNTPNDVRVLTNYLVKKVKAG
jgi:DGQHR domain-containing protein